jgi:glucose/arabinose dehydrogenase
VLCLRPFPVLSVALTLACSPPPASGQDGEAPRSPSPQAVAGPFRVETVARGLEHPWALEFLPDGRIIVTERPGRVRIVDKTGKLSAPLENVPRVRAMGQGGLLDVAVDPQFASNRIVYLSYSEPGDRGASTAVARARLDGSRLEDVRVIYRQQPKTGGGNHFGSRIVFDREGKMFVTQGDRFDQRPLVQDLSTTIGKIVRINPDGSVPNDNPFVEREGVRPEIWSYGHRNLQGADIHPETGQLWTVEHGARGGDELNHPEAGKNYGWPVITYGVDYSGAKIGEGTAREGMEQPVYYWDPVIAPSGLLFYTGDAFPEWKGNLLVGSLQPGGLVRLVMDGDKVAREERYRGELGARIRDVRQGPDGFVYLVTDEGDGRVLRVRPSLARP